MRLLGTLWVPPDVTRDSSQLVTISLGRLIGSRAGDFDSITKTSPLGKNKERSRMLEVRGQWVDRQPFHDGRCLFLLPADNFGEVHRREQILLRFRQYRTRADLPLRIK